MNAQELRKHIAANFPAFAASANKEFDKRRLELALAMVDVLHQLANPDWNNKEQIITSNVITETLKAKGFTYASILSAKSGLEALIEDQ